MGSIVLVNALMTAGFVALLGLVAWGTNRLLGPDAGPPEYRTIDDDQLADSA